MTVPIVICGEVYEGHMCGGKSKLHFAECDGTVEMLPTVAGENETYIPDTFCVTEQKET